MMQFPYRLHGGIRESSLKALICGALGGLENLSVRDAPDLIADRGVLVGSSDSRTINQACT